MSKPMLNIAMPELLATHGKFTLNTANIEWVTFGCMNCSWCKQTFWVLWNFAFSTNGNGGRLQNRFIHRKKPIKMIIIPFAARMPCEVHAAHFRRNYRQIVIEIRAFQMHRHDSIVNGIDFHWITWRKETNSKWKWSRCQCWWWTYRWIFWLAVHQSRVTGPCCSQGIWNICDWLDDFVAPAHGTPGVSFQWPNKLRSNDEFGSFWKLNRILSDSIGVISNEHILPREKTAQIDAIPVIQIMFLLR